MPASWVHENHAPIVSFSHKASNRHLFLFYRSPKRLELEDREDGPHCRVRDGRRGGVSALWQSSERWGSSVIPEHGAVNAWGSDRRSGFVICTPHGGSPSDFSRGEFPSWHANEIRRKVTHLTLFLFVSSGILWFFFFSSFSSSPSYFHSLGLSLSFTLFFFFVSIIYFPLHVSLSRSLSPSLHFSLLLATHEIVSSGSAKLFNETVEPQSLPSFSRLFSPSFSLLSCTHLSPWRK